MALPPSAPLELLPYSCLAPPVRCLVLADVGDWTVTGLALAAVATQAAHAGSPCYLWDCSFWYVKDLFSRKGRRNQEPPVASMCVSPCAYPGIGISGHGNPHSQPGEY